MIVYYQKLCQKRKKPLRKATFILIMSKKILFFLSGNQFEIVDINPHFYSIVSQGLPKPKQLTLHNAGKKDPYARILIKKLS